VPLGTICGFGPFERSQSLSAKELLGGARQREGKAMQAETKDVCLLSLALKEKQLRGQISLESVISSAFIGKKLQQSTFKPAQRRGFLLLLTVL
jgi:hypothetical protein